MTHRIAVLALAASAHAAVARAQGAGAPLESGRTYTLPSRVLGEPRTIDVTLPAGYERGPDARYPVIVVLDGEQLQPVAAAVATFYASAARMPSAIVVGIRTTDRMRDMTTAPVPGFEVPREAGDEHRADRLVAFVGDELLPWLDATYRTAPMRVLVGHSLGGLVALRALGSRPSLFQGYVVMEPSSWWNRGRELADAIATLRSPAARRMRAMLVNMAPTGLDTTQWGGAAPMVRHLGTTGETHASMALPGLTQALRVLFSDFEPPEWRPGMRPIALLERYDTLAARIGYAVPIPASAFRMVARMSIDARRYDDAERVLARWARADGAAGDLAELRARLASERASPPPGRFVQLEVPTRRPTPDGARAFLGRWRAAQDGGYEVEIRAAGDTVTVFERTRLPDGQWIERFVTAIQLAADGTFEWAQPVFRGLAAARVARGRIEADGAMSVSYEVRGWVPVGPGPDVGRVDRLERFD